MKTLKQLLRQPLKTSAGLVLMTLAAAIVCLCVGQALAAESTKKGLDERFSTVAIPSLQEDLSGTEMITVEEELLQWLEKMAREHPDIVKGIAPNGFRSAYIPELMPYNIQAKDNAANYSWDAAFNASGYNTYAGTTHYDSAMLVITLDEIGEPVGPMDGNDEEEPLTREDFKTYHEYQYYLICCGAKERQKQMEQFLRRTQTDGYTVQLKGTITQVLSLPDGYRDPEGMIARLTLTLPSLQDIEALELVPGQQYIVYGMDYFDDYQNLVAYMKTTGFKHISFEPYDPALLKIPTEQEKRSFLENKKIDAVVLYNFVPLEQWQYDRMNAVSMTLCLPGNLIPYESVLDENEEVVDRIPQTEVTYTDGSGQSHTIPMDAYNDRYAVPMIAPLDGSVEDFLASAEGKKWQEALEQSQVNNRAFAVLGVNDLHQLAAFALGKSQMGEGREFTAEEVESGAKVCIVHEWVANNAGLTIGDTIHLSFYGADYGLPYQPAGAQEKGLLRPSANLYFTTTPFVETAEYTIVGFWQGSVWPDADAEYYNFSANTVIVPYASVQSSMEYRSSLPFVSVELENGMIRAFHELAKRSGYAGRFKYTDQGYGDIAVNFHNYESLARQIMLVGIVIYVILLLLYLLLYPASQGKTLWTMESMGCHYGKRFGHVLRSSMFIMVTASVLGGWAGSLLWDRMVAALQATTESSIALELDGQVLVAIVVAQLLVGLLLSGFVAVFVAMPRGIAKRR